MKIKEYLKLFMMLFVLSSCSSTNVNQKFEFYNPSGAKAQWENDIIVGNLMHFINFHREMGDWPRDQKELETFTKILSYVEKEGATEEDWKNYMEGATLALDKISFEKGSEPLKVSIQLEDQTQECLLTYVEKSESKVGYKMNCRFEMSKSDESNQHSISISTKTFDYEFDKDDYKNKKFMPAYTDQDGSLKFVDEKVLQRIKLNEEKQRPRIEEFKKSRISQAVESKATAQ